MGGAASRFRKLPPPRVEAKPRERVRAVGDPGDLFDHFGVTSERTLVLPGAIVAAQPCSACGWLQRPDDLACPLCAEPRTNSTESG